MATVNFKEESPFKQQRRSHCPTDYVYTRFLENLKSTHNVVKDSKRINIAIFGLGRAGTIHIANAASHPKIFISYIVEQDEERSESTKRHFFLTDTKLLKPKNASEVFDDPKVEGIIIATPTATHVDFVIAALKAGKHVMCEKPISLDLEQISKCYDIADKSSGSLFCAMVRRFDPAISEIQRQVRAGKVGQVHLVKTTARDSPLPEMFFFKTSGGIFHDCAIHDVDMICWILGEYPSKVSALASSFIPEIKEMNDFDTVQLTMKFPSGTIASIDMSRNAVYGYDQRVEVFGPKGMVSINQSQPFSLVTSAVAGAVNTPICHSFPSRYFEAFQIELQQFLDLIEGGELSVTKDESIKVAQICTALEKSARSETMVEVEY